MVKKYVDREKFISHRINLDKIRQCIDHALAKIPLPEEDIYRLQLAADEACSNIILHSYSGDSELPIYISIFQDDKAVTITIEDEGDTFNPLNVADPNLDEHIEKYKKNGLGVFLMRRLVDEIRYRAIADKGNRIELIKYF